ncbi:MAG: energy-coupling factor transporter transmembrane protein EcfT [Ardenticatenaceae bacterium]|nr:energy-coupling factor transporter transmembrane protein EcfT [Ardenticatenaceae bacterium]
MFDARGWMTWLLAAVVMTMLTRNPFYTLIILLVAQVVEKACALPDIGLNLPLIRIGLILLAFSTLMNVLFVHIGVTVLFRLPGSWPYIGGPLTLEAAVFGLGNGLILLTLLVIFTTFNKVVTTGELVRLSPRALRDLAVVVLIGLTYVPETMNQLRRIREAQAIRGHQIRGLGDWRPVLIPLLIGGLERAMGVAEAMVARGYGSTADVRQPLKIQLALLVGLLATFLGWVLSFWIGWPGWLVMAAGIVAIGFLLWQLGQQTPFTRYRPDRLTGWNVGLMGTAVLAVLFFIIPIPFLNRVTLAYSPYPQLAWPGFDVFIGLCILLLIYPAVVVLLNDSGTVGRLATATKVADSDDYD